MHLDAGTMATYSALNAQFEDEAISVKGRIAVMGMQRMLFTAMQAESRDQWQLQYNAPRRPGNAATNCAATCRCCRGRKGVAHRLFKRWRCGRPAFLTRS